MRKYLSYLDCDLEFPPVCWTLTAWLMGLVFGWHYSSPDDPAGFWWLDISLGVLAVMVGVEIYTVYLKVRAKA